MKIVLFGFGILSLILGIVGIFIPLLPTTPFLILSAWCFLRSSPKMHSWLYRQPYIGQALKDWEQTGAIRRNVKILAVGLITISMTILWLKVEVFWLKLSVSLILLGVSGFIVSRPEK